jgi:hypothetical protein
MNIEDHQPWKQKRIFIVMSVLYLAYLLLFCVRLIGGWPSMSQHLHMEIPGLAVVFFALWLQLLNEKASGFTMTVAFLLLMDVTRFLLP